MPLRELVRQFQELLRQGIDLLQRDPSARWAVAAVLWLLFMYRAFGRGAGQKRGIWNWYDFLVIGAGALLVWSLSLQHRPY